MGLALGVMLVGLVAGLLTGGSLAAFAETRARAFTLFLLGLGIQLGAVLVLPNDVPEAVFSVVFLASSAALGAFLFLNRARAGLLLTAAGLALNTLVIFVNGGMPVSQSAAVAAGLPAVPERIDVKHELMTSETRLALLAGVIPIAPAKLVVSLGDVLIALGLGTFVYVATRPQEQPARVRIHWPVGVGGGEK